MNISQMKNIVLLKDIPSNIVDEAIIILKNNTNIKNKVINSNLIKYDENSDNKYDFIIKEAENVIQDYIGRIEKNKENKKNIIIKYRKLKAFCFLLGISTIIGIIVSIIN